MQTETKPEGSKYVRGRKPAEIAKLIRAELATVLPATVKASVRCRSSRTSRAIDVTLTPGAGFVIHSLKRLRFELETPHAPMPTPALYRHSDEARALLATVERIVRSYNRENIDFQSDYFDVAFYSDVRFDYAVEAAQREEIVRTLRAAGVGR